MDHFDQALYGELGDLIRQLHNEPDVFHRDPAKGRRAGELLAALLPILWEDGQGPPPGHPG